MKRKLNKIGLVSILLLSFFLLLIPLNQAVLAEESEEGHLVYVIPVEKEVEKGLYSFLKRATTEAEEAGANHIIFEIDSPGGLVDSAGDIGRLIQSLDIPTTAYITNKALSAGSYIALHTDSIYMKPNATMGASGVITSDGNEADKKAQSAWIAAMKSIAEAKDRDPIYAVAMADSSIDLPEYDAPKGKYLTLTASSAEEVGYSEGTKANLQEVLAAEGLSDAHIEEVELTFAEQAARFLTHPVVIPILLSLATLGLVVELYSPGFGVPGSMGLSALILFFYGHIIAGLAGLETIILLSIGIILIVLEFFVAGGILGALGAGSLVAAMLMAGYSISHMLMSIAIAILIAFIAGYVLYKRIGTGKGMFNKLILRDRATTDLGYVTIENRQNLIGLDGIALTTLRPAGTALINNERMDVVTQGDYIEKNEPIEIIYVEGMRVVVRKK
ncbi:MAG TPA: nodulation protein NfeD [Pseudogracilibacillus sp.]|nr:nodulation protein NfeD [Pseudogracilibacillus sp.]